MGAVRSTTFERKRKIYPLKSLLLKTSPLPPPHLSLLLLLLLLLQPQRRRKKRFHLGSFSSDASHSSHTPRDFHQQQQYRRNRLRSYGDYDDDAAPMTPTTPSSPPPLRMTTTTTTRMSNAKRPPSRGDVVSTPTTTTTTTSWEPSDEDGDGISSGGSEFERDVAAELGMSGEGGVARRSRKGMEASSLGGTGSSGGLAKLRLSNAKPAEGSKLGYTFLDG